MMQYVMVGVLALVVVLGGSVGIQSWRLDSAQDTIRTMTDKQAQLTKQLDNQNAAVRKLVTKGEEQYQRIQQAGQQARRAAEEGAVRATQLRETAVPQDCAKAAAWAAGRIPTFMEAWKR